MFNSYIAITDAIRRETIVKDEYISIPIAFSNRESWDVFIWRKWTNG
jgi:hypothetical protein